MSASNVGGFFYETTATPAKPPALRPGQTIQEVASAYLDSFRKKIPDGYFWDWQPFFEALVEGNIAAHGVSVVFPPDDADQMGSPAEADRWRDSHIAVRGKVPKPPGSGSWNYTWYIPEWSHPDFDPSYTVSYVKGFRMSGSRDPVVRLHPALRPQDQIHRPTEWAKRFGIYPGEFGGRSRLSPTLSATRDPWEDYANQVNLLPEEARRKLAQETKDAAIKAGKSLPPEGYIDKAALENLMNTEERMTGQQLRVKMASYLTNDHVPLNLQVEPPTTLEEFVDDLRKNYPQILTAHKTYFQKALDDQDYQRIVFHDMTSDEMVYNNIYTQSDDAICDLEGPVHAWRDSSSKGADRFDPRFLYNLNGVREEWDMRTNDTLWAAMQPALLLLSKMLLSGHPGIQALMDLRTRYKIPDHLVADRDNPRTPNLVGYRPVEEMVLDLKNSWPEMIALNNMGYDFIENTWRVLFYCLRFEISCAWFEPTESDDADAIDGVKETKTLVYGVTQASGSGRDTVISIWIAAELIWPLLVPQYSQSEKLTASFLVASTLMHEFAHAVNCAQCILTSDLFFSRFPGQPPETAFLLRQLANVLWDVDVEDGDPFWDGLGVAELGFDLERSVWGFLTNVMLSGSFIRPSRQIASMPLVAEANPYPVARNPPPPGAIRVGPIKNADFPTENYCHPIPIDYMAQFFRESFWTDVYPTWGPEAMKLSPKDRLLKTTMSTSWVHAPMGEKYYGKAEWWFLSFVYRTLVKNDYHILGEYLRRQAWHLIMPSILSLRWEYDCQQWDIEIIMPLNSHIMTLNNEIEKGQEISRVCGLDYDNLFETYVTQHNRNILSGANPTLMSFVQWSQMYEQNREEYFAVGGIIMRELSATYRAFMKDLAYLQRVMVDFLSLEFNARAHIYTNNGAADKGPLGVMYRHIQEAFEWSQHFVGILNMYSNSATTEHLQHEWVLWETRYRSCYMAYTDLMEMLGDPNRWDPEDISWKRRFTTVPSSYWKNRMDRLGVLAHRQYVKLDPRIRHVFDECEAIMERSQGSGSLPIPFQDFQGSVNSIDRVIRNVKSLGQPPPADRVYNWTAPGPVRKLKEDQPRAFSPDVQPSPTETELPKLDVTPSGKEEIKDTFGVPRDPTKLGTRAPRRLNIPDSGPSGGNLGGSTSAPTSRGGALGGGLNRNRRQSHKGFARWNKDRDGAQFILSAQKMNSLDSLQQIGVPSSIIEEVVRPSPFGTGGRFQTGTGDTIFTPQPIGARAGKQPTLFPNAFANPLITTDESISHDSEHLFQEAQRWEDRRGQQYQTTDIWRDARATGFDNTGGHSPGSSPGSPSAFPSPAPSI
ncbi:hypothetical protein F5Y00DRAFT_271802 [Daldinia vernicosa]|uniref:uncharacterized protein n=1 Tax=Daldinia vernicosa TaxID=114800 RepID=UPI0020083A11|nr:uncharacterized protein F5Y00DRAFT_271802 [Daldinia vernicosa]KAI0846667.1 hypothetical protein F5Y00DRAFT_271802 [Daldinia vernicosa]